MWCTWCGQAHGLSDPQLPIFPPTPALSCSLACGTVYRKQSVTLPQVFPLLPHSGHPLCPRVKAPFPCLLCMVVFWFSSQVSPCPAPLGGVRYPLLPRCQASVRSVPPQPYPGHPVTRLHGGPACSAGLSASAHALGSEGQVSLLAIHRIFFKSLMNCAGPPPPVTPSTEHEAPQAGES